MANLNPANPPVSPPDQFKQWMRERPWVAREVAGLRAKFAAASKTTNAYTGRRKPSGP